ncbi:NAD(P)(+)--arginine ADP-ribosyltransferase 2-like [Leuresthes tenuis]|uniref:NAD(P)(+)--arginine ADP-ribosyltransferase 2-like n=1 Tax=Leuresthes tenuis TaxID=355514 RepID=UPI003B50ABBE
MMNGLIYTLLCPTLCWLLSVDSMRIRRDARHLTMMDDSVDDMYHGCNYKKMKELDSLYPEELKKGLFAEAWKNAETCATENFKKWSKENKDLTKDHMQAICVYTENKNKVYPAFNKAVREQGKEYGTKEFQFHILHFLLTSAIQILNPSNVCYITYRRTDGEYSGKVNEEIRFGMFASSSFRNDQFSYGTKTCFKIKTCLGASLKKYSVHEEEEEVLIPPYEKFTIEKVVKNPHDIEELKDCKLVYVLKGAGHKSTYNCNQFLDKAKL